ncbi:alpha/beta fold hydrolase [Alkalibacter saccharofermentans]|uniref:Pimeloyl-ACP methyl ester carboxylesterase n=1 Tax=Alkalibacter saccharofermentans DSM 14828 TaxID=1120975 RepID=A0A1M4ZCX1_9FIRM|nr:alpha/beta hydrolase [Alkalibacter saccharofermentans]SHF15808.1 Pimeloyl-ACP methyl ester carboxylesterase [Alkalibacter saccharofermentans DSM 14828]
MDKQIKTFKGSGVEIEYLLTGELNAEAVMFVHGAGTNLRQFFAQHEHFSDKYKTLSVSLRGHGLSGHPKVKCGENYSLEKNRDDLIELLEHLNIQKIHFVGNSAGGVIGFYLLKARPDLLSSLTTFGTVGELKYSTSMTRIIAGIDKAMLRWNPRRYLNFLSKNTSKYESVQKEIFEMFMMSTEAIPYIRENLGNYSCLDVINRMTIPYLLIRGEQDKEINSKLTSTLEALAANNKSRVVEIEKAGHIANLDKSEEFNKILAGFWSQIEV